MRGLEANETRARTFFLLLSFLSFLLRIFHRGFEVSDAFAQAFSERGEFTGAEDQKGDGNNYQ